MSMRSATENKKKWVLWFNELTNKDVSLVGGKNASLGVRV